jgi:hypothetical protein
MTIMKTKYIFILPLIALCFTGCKIEEIGNPNGPTLEDFETSTTIDDLVLLATGTEAVMRTDLEFYIDVVSIVGREYYDLNGADPRYTGELLGAEGGPLDPGGFLTTRSYAARYSAIRNAQTLLNALDNTTASLTPAEEAGTRGFSHTVIAYQLLLAANMQYENGIRIDVADPDNLGDFTADYQSALTAISALLDEANGELVDGGDEFFWDLTDGFAGFATPAGFNQFNRGLAARVDLYRGNKTAALANLDDSFFDMAGDLNMGCYHTYDAGDAIFNPLFRTASDLFMAQTDWVESAEAGDTRLGKVVDQGEVIAIDDLSGDSRVNVYLGNDDNAIVIRNEELVLIYAEANIGSNNPEAIAAIDVVRMAAGLPAYAGAPDDAALLDEVLTQRRYSLFGEGHRWVDLRRHDRLADIVLDRPNDVVHIQFPRPLGE